MAKRKYPKLTREEITVENFDYICEVYHDAIEKYTRSNTKYPKADYDEQDIRQEILLAIFECIKNYDEYSTVNFTTHVFTNIKYKLMSYTHKMNPHYKPDGNTRVYFPPNLPLNELDENNSKYYELDVLDGYNHIISLINSIQNNTTKRIAQLRYIDEFSIRDIKKTLQIPMTEITAHLKIVQEAVRKGLNPNE